LKKDLKTPDDRFESATKRTRGSAKASAFPLRLNFLPRTSELGINGLKSLGRDWCSLSTTLAGTLESAVDAARRVGYSTRHPAGGQHATFSGFFESLASHIFVAS
jgi:hypothetical protein